MQIQIKVEGKSGRENLIFSVRFLQKIMVNCKIFPIKIYNQTWYSQSASHETFAIEHALVLIITNFLHMMQNINQHCEVHDYMKTIS